MIHLDCQKYFLRSIPTGKNAPVYWAAIQRIGPGILLAGLCATASAQTLTEVVNQALQAYPSVLSTNAKASAARADITRARSAHFPQLSLTGTSNTFASGTYPTGTARSSLSPSAKLNLWSGGRIDAETQRSEALTLAAEQLQANTLDDVAQLAAEAYLNWAKTADLYSLAVQNVHAHEETLSDIRKISEVDAGRRVDYEQALVRMENATLALQQRKSDFAQAIQRVRRFWTAEMAARPTGLDAAVADSGVLGKIPTSMTQAVELVSNELPAIAQARAQVAAAQAGVRVAKSQYWPTVDLAVSRQTNSATGRQEAFTQLQLNAPLYNGNATSASVEAAASQLKAAEYALEEVQILAREKAALAWQEWASARSRATTGASQSDVGDKLVNAYRQQFRVARRSLLDLLNIQADAFNYRSSARAAFHDERLARVRLLAVTGDLARRFTSEPGRVQLPTR